MKPTDFPEATTTLNPPAGMSPEECVPLRVCRGDDGSLISCWRLSWWERIDALVHGRVWLQVLGSGHPPVALNTLRPFVLSERPRGEG